MPKQEFSLMFWVHHDPGLGRTETERSTSYSYSELLGSCAHSHSHSAIYFLVLKSCISLGELCLMGGVLTLCVCVCVCVCLRACMRACVRVCVCVCVCYEREREN